MAGTMTLVMEDLKVGKEFADLDLDLDLDLDDVEDIEELDIEDITEEDIEAERRLAEIRETNRKLKEDIAMIEKLADRNRRFAAEKKEYERLKEGKARLEEEVKQLTIRVAAMEEKFATLTMVSMSTT